jgi:hypothetical protein
VRRDDIQLPGRPGLGLTVVTDRVGTHLYAGLHMSLGDKETEALAIIDVAQGKVTGTIPLPGTDVSSVAVAPSGSLVYAVGMVEQSATTHGLTIPVLHVVDPIHSRVASTIHLRTALPRFLAAASEHVLITYAGGSEVELIEVGSGKEGALIPLPGHATSTPNGGGMVMDQSGRRVWAVGAAAESGFVVSEVDLASRKVVSTSTFAGRPISIASGFDATGAEIPFVVGRGPESILAGGKNLLTLPQGFTPNEAFADPSPDEAGARYAYITSHTFAGSLLFRATYPAGSHAAPLLTPTPVTLASHGEVAQGLIVVHSPPGSHCRVILIDYKGSSLWRWTDGCPAL